MTDLPTQFLILVGLVILAIIAAQVPRLIRAVEAVAGACP
jgi:hypothetical protein